MGEKYHDYDLSKGNYKINIDTGKSTLVLEDNNFHVSSYHLEEQATVIKGTSGLESTPQKLIVQKSGKENIIFEAPGLAFQPTFYISPDRTQFLFRKKSTAKFSNLTTLNDIVLVNLKNLSMKTVFENNNQSTSLPIWIDNQNFIIAIGPEDFTKRKDLYIVNVNTKAQKRITTSGDVSLW